MTSFHGSLTYSDWLIEWFGFHAGRDLLQYFPEGNFLKQKFYKQPSKLLWFIRYQQRYNQPAFISVNPRTKHNVVYGVERLFFDFDAHKPSQQDRMVCDVRRFISRLKPTIPFVVKTLRGYHIYLFFKQGLFKTSTNELAKEFYTSCQQLLLKGHKYDRLDSQVFGDVKRLSRVPLSWHEGGAYTEVVDQNLKPTKIRGLDFYKMYGLDSEFVERAVRQMCLTRQHRKEQTKYAGTPDGDGSFKIRPCFLYALEQSEMSHQQRLAFLLETYYAGKDGLEEIKGFFKNFTDYNKNITEMQYKWFLNQKIYKQVRPYKCSTMMGYGWCIKNGCEIYRRKMCKMQENKNG